MPTAAPRPCRHPACRALVTGPNGWCESHRQQRRRADDARRGTSAQRGYGSRWQKARAAYLAKHPLCVQCESAGQVSAASVVDHVVPHRGDMRKFWDSDNWQALCKRHHDQKTASEDGGFGR